MDAQSPRDLITHLEDLPDPRRYNVVHSATNLVAMALVAVVADCDDWEQVADFCEHHRAWFSLYLDLPPRGTPSHDTFDRFFGLLDPDSFEAFFQKYTQDLARQDAAAAAAAEDEEEDGDEKKGLQSLAVDGKCARRSFKDANRNSAVHLVSAWCHEQGMTLGQVATDIKSNEITAIPKLLKMLDLRQKLVTIDAIGCQKDIASLIADKGGDYLLQIKGNQPTLLAQSEAGFDRQEIKGTAHEACNRAHGRTELRRVETISSQDAGIDPEVWVGAKAIVRLRAVRLIGEQCSGEDRYYLTSLDAGRAEELLQRCRRHWGIENALHWVLDVAYREDESRIRMNHGAENMGRLRRLSQNLIKVAPSPKKRMSIKRKRMMYGRSLDKIMQVIMPSKVSKA